MWHTDAQIGFGTVLAVAPHHDANSRAPSFTRDIHAFDALLQLACHFDLRAIPARDIDQAGDVRNLHYAVGRSGDTLLEGCTEDRPGDRARDQGNESELGGAHDQISSRTLLASCTAVSTRISSWYVSTSSSCSKALPGSRPSA